ncbi:hypothetical protein [Kitasatospora sp. NPDC085464]|uniref:hypothetical protein n=1 Tax=Kitasatospora sp. NPDC085464 TaxID=3364063 RepID=UPI0037C58D66
MKRTILTTVALLGAAAAWLTPTASAAVPGHDHRDGATAATHRAGPAPSATVICPASTRCNDTSWGG